MKTCLAVTDLRKTFRTGFFRKKMEVLRGVSFAVQEGEIFGFLGPNGSGKTTTIKIILGLIFPDLGQVEILGRSLGNVEVKSLIGFLPDSPYFYSYLTGEEFLNFYGELFQLSHKARIEKVSLLLDLVDLKHARKLPLRKYSRGMLQRIGLAQALINDPQLIIMDEPMEGLDPVGRKHFRDIMLRLKGEGKTIFFSTHILSDVEMICDRVAMMVKGQIKDIGLLSDLLRTKVHSVDVCAVKPEKSLWDEIRQKHPGVTVQGDQMFLSLSESEVSPCLEFLLAKRIRVVSVIPHRDSLEDLFMSGLL